MNRVSVSLPTGRAVNVLHIGGICPLRLCTVRVVGDILEEVDQIRSDQISGILDFCLVRVEFLFYSSYSPDLQM